MAFAADYDLLANFDAAVLALGVAFRADCAVIGQFFMQLLVQLFAGDFGGEQALARIGHLFFWVMPGPFRHQPGEVIFQFGHTVTGECRDKEHFFECDLVVEFLRQRQQRFLLRLVDLVQHQNLALGPFG